jgi:aminoglycoside phosphotransferase family enzyme/predicted kinase
MPDPGEQSAVIDFLSRPSSYPDSVGAVEAITTHASVVFLAGERAYKLKRALKYSYLDYSTLAAREQACRDELRLNRRTAPTLYLDVQALVRDSAGGLRLGGDGTVLDWVVIMRRFPQEALFSALAESGGLSVPLLLHLTDRIAAFHAAAEIVTDEGGAAGIAAVIAINDENLRRTLPDPASTIRIDALNRQTQAAFTQYRDLLDRRRLDGRVRQCHGDLHLGNICLVDGEPTLFDCIEFSRLIACTDVLYDLAFLLMDLLYRDMRQACGRVFNRYLDLSRDETGLPLLSLFLSLRASVRAHVTAAAAPAAGNAAQTREKLRIADAYLGLAATLLEPRAPSLVAIGGLSGSGKSSVAAALAGDLGRAPGARVLRSDIVRKQIFGLAPEQKLPADAYRSEVNEKVYAELLARAEYALSSGHSVIIDAVSARPQERKMMSDFAERQGVAFSGIWLDATAGKLRDRIAGRRKDASDATVDVLDRQLTYDLGPMDWNRLDANRAPEKVVAAAKRLLDLA